MIIRNGLALTVPVEFTSGFPDGNVTWRLLDSAGLLVTSGVVAPSVGAVSINITVPSQYNTLGIGRMLASLDLEWEYLVGGATVGGQLRYDVEARPPFGASKNGVRAKLGVAAIDLPDEEISMVRAYYAFRDLATEDNITAGTDGGSKELAMRDAIEALAALEIIYTLPVRVAKSEDSGTNKFQRQDVDWEAISLALSGIVSRGILAVFPGYDPLLNTGPLFLLATPAIDAYTGSAPSA